MDWGRALMAFTIENPKKICEDGSKRERMIIETVHSLLQGLNADFILCTTEMKTDPETGRMIKREDITK